MRVGKKVLIAAYTYLVGGDHLLRSHRHPVLDQGRTARGIDVGDHAWLGAHVVVTDGSRIGRDAIIGAGAVVVGEVPEFAIAAGIPAKVVRDRRVAATRLMCGIAGIAARDGSALDPAVLEPMVETLHHRGPDEERRPAVAVRARHAAAVDRRSRARPAAVHQRGRQPSRWSPTARSTTSRRSGASSRRAATCSAPASDIEVIVHAYEEYGRRRSSARLRGMFAIACGTAETRTLLAARDRAGEKPLYYAETADGLRARLGDQGAAGRGPKFRASWISSALDQFLTYEYVIAPRTIFKGIRTAAGRRTT